jgi:hypothetical protein
MFTGLDEMERPVEFKPSSLMGDGLHEKGWQIAYTEATPGWIADTLALLLTPMSMGLVD